MSNKAAGTKFEREFAGVLAKNWFWVHLFQDNKNGQPCDVIAAKNGRTYLIDCKNCETDHFIMGRIEENQMNAMILFSMTGNLVGMFAIRFPDGAIYLMPYTKIQELQEAGFKRINGTVCRTQGIALENWLKWSDEDAGDNWK
ncbi:hypothetical protein [[Clostridium] symbiosum]|jgi:Holliday junction resolvase|uniref:hypothetical protein n=1 Tax=Clostridium symbiosum TaxID=1512 RepID=UPI0032190117